MKIEKQVSSLELSKQLKKLGVKQKSVWYWVHGAEGNHNIVLAEIFDGIEPNRTKYHAYSVAELGEMLPGKVCWRGYTNCNKKWSFQFGEFKAESKIEADARAKMLIYLIKNKLIKL